MKTRWPDEDPRRPMTHGSDDPDVRETRRRGIRTPRSGLKDLRFFSCVVGQLRSGADEGALGIDKDFVRPEIPLVDLRCLQFDLVLAGDDNVFDFHTAPGGDCMECDRSLRNRGVFVQQPLAFQLRPEIRWDGLAERFYICLDMVRGKRAWDYRGYDGMRERELHRCRGQGRIGAFYRSCRENSRGEYSADNAPDIPIRAFWELFTKDILVQQGVGDCDDEKVQVDHIQKSRDHAQLVYARPHALYLPARAKFVECPPPTGKQLSQIRVDPGFGIVKPEVEIAGSGVDDGEVRDIEFRPGLFLRTPSVGVNLKLLMTAGKLKFSVPIRESLSHCLLVFRYSFLACHIRCKGVGEGNLESHPNHDRHSLVNIPLLQFFLPRTYLLSNRIG